MAVDINQAKNQPNLALKSAELSVQSCVENIHFSPSETHSYDEIHKYDET